MTSPLSSMQPAHTRLMHRGDPTRPVQAPRTTTKGEVTGGDGELSLSLSLLTASRAHPLPPMAGTLWRSHVVSPRSTETVSTKGQWLYRAGNGGDRDKLLRRAPNHLP